MSIGGSTRAGWALFLACTACSEPSASLVLRFEHENLQAATNAIEIFAIERQSSAAQNGRCEDNLKSLAEGQPLQSELVAPPITLPIDRLEIGNFPAGAQTIIVVGYEDPEERQRPIAVGCSEALDTDEGETEVEILLGPLIPRQTVFLKLRGDLQVSRPGAKLTIPIETRVTRAFEGNVGFPLPGIEISLSASEGIALDSAPPGTPITAFTDVDGVASVEVTLPNGTGTFEVVAEAKPLFERVTFDSDTDLEKKRLASSVRFSVSAVAAPSFDPPRARMRASPSTRVISMAAGRLSSASRVDLLVLSCEGSDASCELGANRAPPYGNVRLSIFDDLAAGSSNERPLTGTFGIAPADILVGQLGLAELDQVALLEGRTGTDERGLIRFDGLSGNELVELAQFTLSASNAVALASLGPANGDHSLIVAAQGRSSKGHACVMGSQCSLDFSEAFCASSKFCGCRPDEQCVPSDEPGAGPNDGVCVSQDKELELVTNLGGGNFADPDACRRPLLSCPRSSPGTGSCECADNPSAHCTADPCGCPVPQRIDVGSGGGVPPLSVAAAGSSVVAGTVGSLAFFDESGPSFDQGGEKLVNDPVDLVAWADLLEDGIEDVVWASRSGCRSFSGADPCPIVSLGEDSGGCLGMYLRASEDSESLCRRFPVEQPVSALCAGDFNGDDHLDLALSLEGSSQIGVYSGDGRGGIEVPPIWVDTSLSAPRIACVDLDGDSRADLVALSSGGLAVLKSR